MSGELGTGQLCIIIIISSLVRRSWIGVTVFASLRHAACGPKSMPRRGSRCFGEESVHTSCLVKAVVFGMGALSPALEEELSCQYLAALLANCEASDARSFACRTVC